MAADSQGDDDGLRFIGEVITIENKSRSPPSPSIATKSFFYVENF